MSVRSTFNGRADELATLDVVNRVAVDIGPTVQRIEGVRFSGASKHQQAQIHEKTRMLVSK